MISVVPLGEHPFFLPSTPNDRDLLSSDYAAEQADEIEALQSIFPDELQGENARTHKSTHAST